MGLMSASDNKGNLLDLLRNVLEMAMPDMRHYYRMVRKARVVAAYPSDGKYYADVQPLRNDESDDAKEPVVPKVEIPIMWGGPKRGIVCPPTVGTLCDLSYYDGDPNYPRVSNFRWQENAAPAAGLDELIIQQTPGVHIHIDAGGNIHLQTGQNITLSAGQNITLTAGQNMVMKASKILLN